MCNVSIITEFPNTKLWLVNFNYTIRLYSRLCASGFFFIYDYLTRNIKLINWCNEGKWCSLKLLKESWLFITLNIIEKFYKVLICYTISTWRHRVACLYTMYINTFLMLWQNWIKYLVVSSYVLKSAYTTYK